MTKSQKPQPPTPTPPDTSPGDGEYPEQGVVLRAVLPVPGALFPLGAITITEAAAAFIARHQVNLGQLLYRHCHGDWGTVASEVDREEHDDNERVLKGWAHGVGSHVLSKYRIAGLPVVDDPMYSGHLWIRTGDGTTVLLPGEYS